MKTAQNKDKASVLVVDDSFFMRKVICDMLADDPRVQVVGQAGDGLEALEKIEKLRPDVMTLDLEMPKLDGLSLLRKLQQAEFAPATVVVSAHSRQAAPITLDCLAAGAIDFVLKPSESNAWELQNTIADLRTKLAAAIAAGARYGQESSHTPTPEAPKLSGDQPFSALLIGASTGGPVALEHILQQLPEHIGCPVIVAQHMPAIFFTALAQNLAKACKPPVVVAEDGQPVRPGNVYFCPGGAITEIVVKAEPTFRVQPSDAALTPSIDALMTTAAGYYAERTCALILTGMGEDGLDGARAVHQKGGMVLVQDQASSAVFGMGKAVADAGLADALLPLAELIPKVLPRLTAADQKA